jgi:GMP synthase-like glutamine amidotransferase
MRIGILRADAVKPGLARQHGDYPDMFRALLRAAPDVPGGLEFEDFDACAGELPAAGACDGYLITGSRHSVYDDLPWIAPLARFAGEAMDAGRRVVGICFGHQLIAHFFGGETRKAGVGWCVGVHTARIVERRPWMTPPADTLRLLASHQDQVVRLPPAAVPFAAGDTCPHAGFELAAARGRGAAMTLQGHPEFTPDYARDLMDTRVDALGEAVYRAGLASLAVPTSHAVAAAWMVRFLGAEG